MGVERLVVAQSLQRGAMADQHQRSAPAGEREGEPAELTEPHAEVQAQARAWRPGPAEADKDDVALLTLDPVDRIDHVESELLVRTPPFVEPRPHAPGLLSVEAQ